MFQNILIMVLKQTNYSCLQFKIVNYENYGKLMKMDAHPLANKLKLDFNVNVDLSDVVFIKGNIRKYNETSASNVFGEKLCLVYTIDFLIYNVPFSLKILAFAYVS